MLPDWPLLGREHERDRLLAARRRGASVLLTGPSGIGASRLAAEYGDHRTMAVREDDVVAPVEPAVVRIDLPPLPGAVVDDLVHRTLPGAVDEGLGRWLRAAAAGNPGVLRIVLEDGLVSGSITQDEEGTWIRAQAPLTPGLVPALRRHRSSLSPDEWFGREVVAVAGRLGLVQLERLVGAGAVESLLARGMLVLERSGQRRQVRIPDDAQVATALARIGPLEMRTILTRLIDAVESAGALRADDAPRLELWRAANNPAAEWQSLAFATCFQHGLQGRLDLAEEHAASGLRISLAAGDNESTGLFAVPLTVAAVAQGRPRTAVLHADDAIRTMVDVDRDDALTYAFCNRALGLAALGDGEGARQAMADLDALGLRRPPLFLEVERAWAWALATTGEAEAAVTRLLACAEELRGLDRHSEEALVLHDAARLGGAVAAAERGGWLVGRRTFPMAKAGLEFVLALAAGDVDGLTAAAERFEQLGARLYAAEAWAQVATRVHAAGDKAASAAASARSREAAAACEGAVTPLLAVPDPFDALSRREREVARLAAAGLTDRQIAEALTVSVRTAESHLAHIYTKLGIRGRAELADLHAALGAAV